MRSVSKLVQRKSWKKGQLKRLSLSPRRTRAIFGRRFLFSTEISDGIPFKPHRRPALFLRLPKAHAGRVAVGEFHPGLFQHALDGGEIVARRHAPAFLEIDDDVARYVRRLGKNGLIHCDQAPGGAALGWRYGHAKR